VFRERGAAGQPPLVGESQPLVARSRPAIANPSLSCGTHSIVAAMKQLTVNLLIPTTLAMLGTGATARPTKMAHRATPTASAAKSTTAPSYSLTLVSFPGTLNTFGVGINLGAVCPSDEQPHIAVVGAEFIPNTETQTGFAAHVFDNGETVDESYQLLNDPAAPKPQQAYSVNDYGEVVGDYIDAAGTFHSYVLERGVYRSFDVPFAGATGTYSPAVNDSGWIVGSWNDSAGNAHGYTLVAGKFVSFDVPGSAQAQFYYGINSAGDIAGSFADASGTVHGFVRRGTKYTQIDFPGSTFTEPSGINDSGEIVGSYCLTAQCASTGEGELGFVWRNGTFTTFTAVTGEFAVGLGSINNDGVVMGNYVDAAGLVYTFLASPN
jgi:hypothetical protein